MIYIAHPYSGREENKQKVEKIIRELSALKGITHVSPIHSFGFMYNDLPYDEGVRLCLDLLSKCEAIVLCGDWRMSKGCKKEYSFALSLGIKIFESLEEYKEAMVFDEIPPLKKEIVMLSAVNLAGSIGKNNDLMYELPNDMEKFKTRTVGNIVIMGHNTFVSLGRRPLSNRINIVVSTQPSVALDETVEVFGTLEEAIEYAQRLKQGDKIYLIGGESIYNEGMMFADKIIITEVQHYEKGDRYFPDIPEGFTEDLGIYEIDGEWLTREIIYER